MRRKLLGALGFGTGALAVTAFLRRSAERRRERVDLYFADGSMLSLSDGSADGGRLLPLARDVLHAARA
jgi:hypothetical protein